MSDIIDYKIYGDDMQIVEIELLQLLLSKKGENKKASPVLEAIFYILSKSFSRYIDFICLLAIICFIGGSFRITARTAAIALRLLKA